MICDWFYDFGQAEEATASSLGARPTMSIDEAAPVEAIRPFAVVDNTVGYCIVVQDKEGVDDMPLVDVCYTPQHMLCLLRVVEDSRQPKEAAASLPKKRNGMRLLPPI